jgi:hypothetical protein
MSFQSSKNSPFSFIFQCFPSRFPPPPTKVTGRKGKAFASWVLKGVISLISFQTALCAFLSCLPKMSKPTFVFRSLWGRNGFLATARNGAKPEQCERRRARSSPARTPGTGGRAGWWTAVGRDNVAGLDAELTEFFCVEGTQLYSYFAHAAFLGCELVHHFAVDKMREFGEADGQIPEEHIRLRRRWQGARDRLSFGLSEWPYIELVRAQK